MIDTAIKGRAGGKHRFARHYLSAIAVAALLGVGSSAGAFEINTGNEDIKLNWDNTLRYSYAYRTSNQNQALLKNINGDDGNRNFDVGTVNNRLDIFSELGVSYKKDYGVRVSGAGWYDQRYDDRLDNNSLSTSNHIDPNGRQTFGLNNFTKRHFAGPSGELLDAFAHAKFEFGEIPLYVKVGRSTVYWGEGLLSPFNSISYSQMPLDLAKATALPGVETKELFRPLNNVTVTVNPTQDISLSGQYFLQWEEDRIPEAGTYFGTSDVVLKGGETLLFAPGGAPGTYLRQGNSIEPEQARDFGFMARWSPDWLNGTVGLYYRNFSDRLPQVGLNLGAGTYHASYASGIQLYGLSVGKTMGGVAYSGEVSYRKDMPLNSNAAIVTSLPGRGDTFGARGDTWHALVNAIATVPNGSLFGTKLWDLGVLLAELDWNHLDRVSSKRELYTGYDATNNNVSKPTGDALATTIVFTPTWYQVLPGVDLSMPLSFGMGLHGNSAVGNGGNKNAGTWGAGFSADIYQKYKADLKYADYFGSFNTDANGAAVTQGTAADLKDRGFVSLTLKTTF